MQALSESKNAHDRLIAEIEALNERERKLSGRIGRAVLDGESAALVRGLHADRLDLRSRLEGLHDALWLVVGPQGEAASNLGTES